MTVFDSIIAGIIGISLGCVVLSFVQITRRGRAFDRREYVADRPRPRWADPALPAPATAAARHDPLRDLAMAFRQAEHEGLWQPCAAAAGPDSLMLQPGSPGAIRDLLAGVADTLLTEAACAAVRGDETNARALVMLEQGVRDTYDAIDDARR